ncbi:hypothetical protein [Flavobacterium reichenbachii]|uniref:Thioesterase n=1 Tax=Flavobacterium reichenbachii TaxID=362418 RepID=A0A085ZEV3_9FLAO|nr:hypothetical protein [Flavobacterium reichenbachii]KFF02967.1 hypothetical protein IW19_22785 [Flavobacterium reichenbachii]OXB16961.1 hypothetical protein B0A68_05925 [Flavobacterium reichenbachii]
MICKNYTVTGEDVNDIMVMESNAYFSYTIKILYHFLFDKGFSKQKLNSLNLALQEGNSELVCYKNLMFTEDFFIEMKHFHMDKNINIKSRFFNSKNECCAEVTKEFEWFDDIRREVIATPVKILKGFSPFMK